MKRCEQRFNAHPEYSLEEISEGAEKLPGNPVFSGRSRGGTEAFCRSFLLSYSELLLPGFSPGVPCCLRTESDDPFSHLFFRDEKIPAGSGAQVFLLKGKIRLLPET
jgi:hypothetical protein